MGIEKKKKIDLVFVGGQNLLGFCVRAENDLFLVRDRLTWFLWVVENDFVFMCGLKMTWL